MGGGYRSPGASVAGRCRADLWAGQEALSAAPPGAGKLSDALWKSEGTPLHLAWVGTERATQHRRCRAPQPDGSAERGGPDAPHVVNHAASTPVAASLGMVRGYYHFVRLHESLRVVLAQPIDRGGRRQPQRYRQRTPAMAAGLTGRRWTVQELLMVPLPPAPIGAG